MYLVEYAVMMSNHAAMYNMGQCCTAGSRTYVHEDIYEAFVEKTVQQAKAITTGDPFNKDMQFGALVSS
jgi:acyl-CoA reductase-like NAD-dependent aldehyde dehydrogenase